jgi:phosphopantothenoylcysteine decarboxylase / phosphopantothenate---cysteine ligase
MTLQGKRILLVIAGGIAAYKSLDLIRRLSERGARTRCILTKAGAEFVTPLSVAALSGDKVYMELFSLTDEAEMGHIRLSREADLVVVAPATADLMAKMAAGMADDLATTALLATDKAVLIAPTMNVQMWAHAATRRNVARLLADGILAVGPEAGDLACGEIGSGRMAEPLEIVAAIERFFAGPSALPLAGKQVLVTSGPTYESIDPVRYIANRSSGKQGHAIAAALAALGAEVALVSGPVHEPDPRGVKLVKVETARQMLAACEAALPVDAAIFAAAVADWRPAKAGAQKVKKEAGVAPPALELTENPDILATVSKPGAKRPALVIGFAAETEKVEAHAKAKLKRKGCDWIVANDVSGDVMGGDRNTVTLISAQGLENWPTDTKQGVAARLARRIAEHFNAPSRKAAE